MVKDHHDHDRIAALFPRMVTECLAQGMAADVSLDADRVRGGSDHAVRLRARDRGAPFWDSERERDFRSCTFRFLPVPGGILRAQSASHDSEGSDFLCRSFVP